MDGQRQLLREAMSPPDMTDAEMRRRMAREVLAGTKDRLENSPPIGWDPVTKTIRTAMPVLRVVPDVAPDRAGKSPGPPKRRSPG
jgi:hypothetical protein